MKLRYLLPFLFFLYPEKAQAQFKIEGNQRNLDVKSKILDVSARNSLGLEDYINVTGDAKLKYRNNALYLIRNGLQNHTYGGNIDFGLADGYYNRTEQNIRDETTNIQNSPIGQITTKTTILNEIRARDFGVSLNYRNFFASYESATSENKIDGNTLITINGDEQLVNFSSEFDSRSNIYGIGFKNGFFKFIENRHQNIENGMQNEERFNNYLINANYSFGGLKEDLVNLNIYYGRGDISGFFNFNLLGNMGIDLIYDSGDGNFTVNLSTQDYSRLDHRDFERSIENRLRAVPRIYDSNLETTRRYLRDMFFTKPFSYNFSISTNEEDGITANLNLRNILFHYSEGSQAIGLKLGPAIGTYDFEQNEARFGVFLGRVK